MTSRRDAMCSDPEAQRTEARDSLVLEQPSTADLQVVRDWARGVLDRRDDDVELVLTELLTNAIVHGEPGPVVVDIGPGTNNVVITVSNPSSGDLPSPADLSDTVSAGSVSRRGRGLLIAAAISESLTVSSHDGTLVVSATVPTR